MTFTKDIKLLRLKEERKQIRNTKDNIIEGMIWIADIIRNQTNNICCSWNHIHRQHNHCESEEAVLVAGKETEVPLLGNEWVLVR